MRPRQILATVPLAGLCWLTAIGACRPAYAQTESGFTSLFDGKSLAGWRGFRQSSVPDGWTVDDQAIRGSGTGPDLMTEQQYGDFELRFEWKIEPGSNSGVIYRVQEEGVEQTYQSGIEYQILDDEQFKRELTPTQATAAIYGLYGEPDKVLRATGEYNSARIIARGNRLEHWLNDELVVECVRGSADWNKRLAASKFHAWPTFARSQRGHIALQSHGGAVWFRNLRIQPLDHAHAKP
jgi:hypothetical protein